MIECHQIIAPGCIIVLGETDCMIIQITDINIYYLIQHAVGLQLTSMLCNKLSDGSSLSVIHSSLLTAHSLEHTPTGQHTTLAWVGSTYHRVDC